MPKTQKLTTADRRILREFKAVGSIISKMPSAKFRKGKYNYRRSTTGYQRQLISPRTKGKRKWTKITLKEFLRAWGSK